jgi:hypothetical protein
MLRTIGAVVLGYLGMALAVFAGLSAAYLVMGADRAFRPGVYDVSTLWAVTSIAIGLCAALFGGWLSRKVGHTANAPRALAALVVVLGVLIALPALSDAAAAGVRSDSVGVFEAMQYAHTPAWLLLLNPLIGALGVLVGGRALARNDERIGATAAG